jgi:hypothetical protein
MVIFMTDGEPTIGVTRPADIRRNVRKANEALTRLFVFGIGDDLNAELLDLLAEENHGTRDYVGNDENIELKISSFFQKVSSPVLSGLSVTVTGIETKDVYPKKLPDLFRGSQLLVTGRFKGTGKATILLKGSINGRQEAHEFQVDFKKGSDKTAYVSRLWAVRKVGYLMDQIRLTGENEEVKKEVVRLGKKYGIVTPYTSYLVVEDAVASSRRVNRPTRGSRRRAGRGGGGFFGGRGRADRGGARDASGDASVLPLGETKTGEKDKRAEGKTRSYGFSVKADEFLKAEAEKATKRPVDSSTSADRSRTIRLGDDGKPEHHAERALKESRKKALDSLIDNYFTDSISLSKHVKNLRETGSARTGSAGMLVRRVGNRTFYHRSGYLIEASLLDLDSKAIKARLVRIEAFSAEYMRLISTRKDLARILALGDRLLFIDGTRIIQIVSAPVIEKTAGPKPRKAPVKK